MKEFYQSPDIHKSELQTVLPKPYDFRDDFSPIVSTEDNFDNLLIQKDHPSRKRSDTYYLNEDTILRCHTSAHQNEMLKSGSEAFCVLGDVYRKDEVDASHYPVFHQMEALRYYPVEDLRRVLNENFGDLEISKEEIIQREAYNYFGGDVTEEELGMVQLVVNDLKETHTNLVRYLLDLPDLKSRWNADYFPFTEPSYELEVFYGDDWLELLGSGIVHKDVLGKGEVDHTQNIGWASGIGLERFAILLFQIPDIRLFWSQDDRFIRQFSEGEITTFEPFSKYPACSKDVAFYVRKLRFSKKKNQ